MDKPVLLDLYCRKGGATVGYQRAGFYVIGVDIEPQPGYPGDEFWQMDVIELLKKMLATPFGMGWIRLVHGSPPCQEGNTAVATNRTRGIVDTHVQLVPPTRDLLRKTGIPYVIEQPTSSRKGLIRRDVTLCMDMFKGELPPPWVQKHRSFELGGMYSWDTARIKAAVPKHPKHQGRVRGWRHGACYDGPYVAGYGKGGGKATAEELRHAMGVDWMTDRFDLCEAIPPAYTEWLGRQFLAGHS